VEYWQLYLAGAFQTQFDGRIARQSTSEHDGIKTNNRAFVMSL
jgi:hypothetical protein